MDYLIAHAMTIEGVFIFIIVLSIVGVYAQDWIDRYLHRRAIKTRNELDQFLGPESFRQRGDE